MTTLKRICVWCAPPHVIEDGDEPATFGMCEVAKAKLDAQLTLLEQQKHSWRPFNHGGHEEPKP